MGTQADKDVAVGWDAGHRAELGAAGKDPLAGEGQSPDFPCNLEAF